MQFNYYVHLLNECLAVNCAYVCVHIFLDTEDVYRNVI